MIAATSDRPGDWGSVWPAPAKLNLCLQIVGRRDDGYHRLQSALQLIDLCDSLSFAPEKRGRVTLDSDVTDWPADQDLSVRAARLLIDEAGPDSGVAICLNKRIPVGGGLGGGSSDAATTLLALNHLWGLGLDLASLADLGLRLGADVPFFVRGENAWAEEIGEALTSHPWPPNWYLVVEPGVRVATGEIFSAPALTRNSPPITIRSFLRFGAGNDCEPVVRDRYPAVGEALDWLGRFGRAQLTGTGGCVFLACENLERAIGCKEALKLRSSSRRWTSWVVPGLDRSPLVETLRMANRQRS